MLTWFFLSISIMTPPEEEQISQKEEQNDANKKTIDKIKKNPIVNCIVFVSDDLWSVWIDGLLVKNYNQKFDWGCLKKVNHDNVLIKEQNGVEKLLSPGN